MDVGGGKKFGWWEESWNILRRSGFVNVSHQRAAAILRTRKEKKREKWPLIHQISSVHHWRICHQTILVSFFLSFFLSYTQTISSQPMHGRGMSGSSRLYYKSVIKNESSSSSLNVRNQLTTTKMSTLLLAAAIFSILLLFLFGSF